MKSVYLYLADVYLFCMCFFLPLTEVEFQYLHISFETEQLLLLGTGRVGFSPILNDLNLSHTTRQSVKVPTSVNRDVDPNLFTPRRFGPQLSFREGMSLP